MFRRQPVPVRGSPDIARWKRERTLVGAEMPDGTVAEM